MIFSLVVGEKIVLCLAKSGLSFGWQRVKCCLVGGEYTVIWLVESGLSFDWWRVDCNLVG